ncbi:MAG TPA: glycosyltransferase family 4 protein [Acidimicrobiales bacterium]|nr:glycosyltransferase family 4 protein [Acidimicrobiales bacterium]
MTLAGGRIGDPRRNDGSATPPPGALLRGATSAARPALPTLAARAPTPAAPDTALRAIAAESGLERIRIVAWRDLDDPEAGGSELHAHRIASLWAAAGIDVELRTSSVANGPRNLERDGYRVLRHGGRYGVFVRRGVEELSRRSGRGREGRTRRAGRTGRAGRGGEGLVEIWNGMPFWSPLWFRGPRVVFLHHVHAEMWRMVLPAWMARIGEAAEKRIAPPLYRSTRVVTLSESSRAEIVDMLGLDANRIAVVPPGVEPRFSPGSRGARSPEPLVVAVGRLVPVKRFDLLLRALSHVKRSVPDLRAVIVGEGYERPRLEALRHELAATAWVSLPGRVHADELVDLYRRAWVAVAVSRREGWGMTLTEAGACGTPAVASDIAGHRDAVAHGRSGLLAESEADIGAAIARVLRDADLRARLGAGAQAHAQRLTWEAAARATLEVLAEEACWATGDYPLSLDDGVMA